MRAGMRYRRLLRQLLLRGRGIDHVLTLQRALRRFWTIRRQPIVRSSRLIAIGYTGEEATSGTDRPSSQGRRRRRSRQMIRSLGLNRQGCGAADDGGDRGNACSGAISGVETRIATGIHAGGCCRRFCRRRRRG